MKRCEFCGATSNIHKHHIYAGPWRKTSEKYGAIAYLCYAHHNGSNNSVHLNHEIDLKLKQKWQKKFELTHTHDEFISIFGRSYL
jgi:hypothetical protein